MSRGITFEHPLNERTRLLLRLAHLFDQFAIYQPRPDVWDSRSAIGTLLDLTSLLSRSDIKSEVIKELERHHTKLTQIRHAPGIDSQRLGTVLDALESNLSALHRTSGQLGQCLREDEFLKAVTQRSSLPGGTCTFDLPIFHYWLESPAEERVNQLATWAEPLLSLKRSISLLVELIRTSSRPEPKIAENGFLQQTLDTQSPVQMLRVTIPFDSGYIAEVSGGKHRFTVRFLELQEISKRPIQVKENVAFQLTTCIL